jgi:hypothetical protein
VLKGNETGERATTQDLKEWYGKIQERREEFVTPTIVRELIDRLIKYDILPTPSDGPAAYSVEWSPLAELAESDVADIQMTRAEMLNEWTGGNPDDYFTREQQRKIVEDGVFPSEMEEIEETLVDENDGDVQGQFETIQADAPPALPDGGEEGGD